MGRQSNNVKATGVSIFGLAFILLTFMLLPIMALLRATKGTVWHKWVIMSLIGLGYYGYMDVARVNKCNEQQPYRGCPPAKLSDYVPHDW
jgi:hypothetical protein